MDVREKLVDVFDKIGCENLEKAAYSQSDYERLISDLIANGVTVQEWISVKDRLPEKSGLVIGYDIVWGVGCFYYHTDMQTSTWQQITHWMPLPQPPKGE